MSIVRFATTCDTEGCTNRIAEYSRLAVCRECGLDVCPEHIVPGSLDEESGKALCVGCVEAIQKDAGELARMESVTTRSLQWARDFREAIR